MDTDNTEKRRGTMEIASYARELARGDLEPTARVVLPPDEDLTVTLLKKEDILRFDEARGDEQTTFGYLTTATGVFLGIVTNVLTSGQWPNAPSWAAGVATLFIIGALVHLYSKARKRAADARSRLKFNE